MSTAASKPGRAHLLESLAKMWVMADPNRDPGMIDRKSDLHGENLPEPFRFDGFKSMPRWMWFLPRAEAAMQYLEKCGITFAMIPEQVYCFHRGETWYPLALHGDAAAIVNAEHNPGTTKVTTVDGRLVWPVPKDPEPAPAA